MIGATNAPLFPSRYVMVRINNVTCYAPNQKISRCNLSRAGSSSGGGLNIRKQLIELLCGGLLSFEALLLQIICSVCGSLRTTDVSTSGLGFPARFTGKRATVAL